MSFNKLTISVKEVQRILGLSYEGARKHLLNIKMVLNKQPEQKITYYEFCNYEGISESDLNKFIQ